MAIFWLASAVALAVMMPFLVTRGSLRFARSWIILLTGGFSLIGVPALLIGGSMGLVVLFGVGTVCSGIGLALLWLIWADRFAVMSSRDIYLYTICNTVVMIAFNLIGNIFPSAQSTAEILLVLSPLTSLILLLRDWKKDGSWLGEEIGSARTLLTTKSLIGLCVVMFFFPFAYQLSIVSLFSDVSLLGRDGSDIIALVVFALILKGAKGRTNIITIYRVAIPLVLGGFLLCYFLPAQASALNALVAGGGLKLASLFFWVLLLGAVPDDRSRWLVLTSGLGVRFRGNSIALLPEYFLPDRTFDPPNNLLAMAIIIVVLTCVILWTLPNRFDAEPDGIHASGVSAGGTLEVICAGIAKKYRLTTRESEVLCLLAQGRNEGAIAEMLKVGRGTAHTHILHVYQKLDIHSQQELIALVHGKKPASSLPTG